MMSVKRHSEGTKIPVVTHGGAQTYIDMEIQGNQTEHWVRKLVGPMPAFNP
jgi:hypothetical protein